MSRIRVWLNDASLGLLTLALVAFVTNLAVGPRWVLLALGWSLLALGATSPLEYLRSAEGAVSHDG